MTPSVGRIAHYVNKDGAHWAAMIAAVTDGTEGTPVNLWAFGATEGIFLYEAVPYSEEPLDGTWHWPERVE